MALPCSPREAFERFLETPPEDVPHIRRLYDLAKQDTAGFEAYAERIGRLLRDEPDVTRCVLECLIYVACSDGVLHPAEDEFLRTVAEKFGFSRRRVSHDARAVRARLPTAPTKFWASHPTRPTPRSRRTFAGSSASCIPIG